MTEYENSLVDIAIKADIKTLYAVIGSSVSKNQLGVSPSDKEALVNAGMSWVKDKQNELKTLVCADPNIRKLFLSNNLKIADTRDAILIVTDLIITICQGIPAVYVAALIVKIGLREWCNGS
jgi:hypothetical protein